MSKKIITAVLAFVMSVAMLMPVGAAGDGDNYGEDIFGGNVTIRNVNLYGDYELGTEKVFTTSTYCGLDQGMELYRKIDIYGDGRLSDLEYMNDEGEWRPIDEYNGYFVLVNDVDRKFRVTFYDAGPYHIDYFWYDLDGTEIMHRYRDIQVTETEIMEYVEEEETEETTTKEPASTIPTTCTITIDGELIDTVDYAARYTLPSEAKYGYCSGTDKIYRPGAKFNVTSNLDLTSLNEFSLSMTRGASINLGDDSGIRFKSYLLSDNELVYDASYLETGTLITTADVCEEYGMPELNPIYDMYSLYDTSDNVIRVINDGWYNDQNGTYCGSVIDIDKDNYERDFTARAYAVLLYTDGSRKTVYSDMSDYRSISYVANAIIDGGTLDNYTLEQQEKIKIYAGVQ